MRFSLVEGPRGFEMASTQKKKKKLVALRKSQETVVQLCELKCLGAGRPIPPDTYPVKRDVDGQGFGRGSNAKGMTVPKDPGRVDIRDRE